MELLPGVTAASSDAAIAAAYRAHLASPHSPATTTPAGSSSAPHSNLAAAAHPGVASAVSPWLSDIADVADDVTREHARPAAARPVAAALQQHLRARAAQVAADVARLQGASPGSDGDEATPEAAWLAVVTAEATALRVTHEQGRWDEDSAAGEFFAALAQGLAELWGTPARASHRTDPGATGLGRALHAVRDAILEAHRRAGVDRPHHDADVLLPWALVTAVASAATAAQLAAEDDTELPSMLLAVADAAAADTVTVVGEHLPTLEVAFLLLAHRAPNARSMLEDAGRVLYERLGRPYLAALTLDERLATHSLTLQGAQYLASHGAPTGVRRVRRRRWHLPTTLAIGLSAGAWLGNTHPGWWPF